ncbi:helix-turn-helix transcriptional regulator [Bordetella tumulicola]|uniref:helix-turn-helix transcriptional regulator n=1 Tax=Bordetella tumulicola TaxID=1649133 RepID=UPI0039EE3521
MPVSAATSPIIPPQPELYSAPIKPHEWWRGTLPTVPATDDWEAVIDCVLRVEEGVSLVVLDGSPPRALTIPAPGAPVFGMQVWLEGSATLALDGGEPLRLNAGAGLLFNHEKPMRWAMQLHAKQRVRMVDVRFTPEALARAGDTTLVALLRERFRHDASVPAHGSLVATVDAPSSLRALANALSGDAPSSPGARRLWYRAKSLEMLSAFVQVLSLPQALCSPTERELQQLHDACQLLRERYAERWPPARLARAVGLSEKRLQQIMRDRLGRSVHAQLSEVRLERASGLLHAGASVTEVAWDVGFSSLSHFSKIFKARYGISPRAR